MLPPPGMRFHAGDRVFAVGSPIGLENSITAGVVSSLSRKIISFGEAAQIDVPVNQGNSGSPLFLRTEFWSAWSLLDCHHFRT